MAARGRSSPARGGPSRRDSRPGGQRGFKKSTHDSRDRPRPAPLRREESGASPGIDDRVSSRSARHSENKPRVRRSETGGVGKPSPGQRVAEGDAGQRERAGASSAGRRGARGELIAGRRERSGEGSAGRRERSGSNRSSGGEGARGTQSRRGAPGPRTESPSPRPQNTERESPARGEPERLQKVLARIGVASRREAEEWIRAGRLTVNGEPAVLGMRVGRTDHLRLDGRLIHRHEVAAGQAYLCHRSPGENLRTPEEPTEHQALMDRLPRRAGNRFIAVSPMPRSDGGLEIVTSDGNLAVQLQRTVHSLPSEFSVRVRGELEEHTLRGILQGTLDRGINLQVESCEAGGGEGTNRWYTIVARGGSGKDVRQLFERHGALVSRVLRTRLGSLELDRELSRGQFRLLTQDEIQALLASPAGQNAPE